VVLREYRQEQQVERFYQLYSELYARFAGAARPPVAVAG
jgi:hypothetical protein